MRGGLLAKECLVTTLAGDTSQPHPLCTVKRGDPRMGGCDSVDHGKEPGRWSVPKGPSWAPSQGTRCWSIPHMWGDLGQGSPSQGDSPAGGKPPEGPSVLPEVKSWWLPGGCFWSSSKSRKILFTNQLSLG